MVSANSVTVRKERNNSINMSASKNIFAFILALAFTLILSVVVNGEEGKDKEMVFVKGGCYQMGDIFSNVEINNKKRDEKTVHKVNDEKPVHEVCVDDFYIGKFEVTVGEFRKFVNATGYIEDENNNGCFAFVGREWKKDKNKNWSNPGFSQDDSHPVCCVSWNDAMAYTVWLSDKTGNIYRLPTEAEWEYAARSGGKIEKWAGTNSESALSDYAWYGNNSGGKTHFVGQKNPNNLGLYDMSGNVWEWCSDWYDDKYYSYAKKDNPKGPDIGVSRVLRGGSWYNAPNRLSSSVRTEREPDKRADGSGFRLAASIK